MSRAPHTKKEAVASASLHLQRLRTGAADEARTRYVHLGKVALDQLSYGRICGIIFQDFRFLCLRSESNQLHGYFQSPALPTELQRQKSDPDRARTDDPQRDRLVL